MQLPNPIPTKSVEFRDLKPYQGGWILWEHNPPRGAGYIYILVLSSNETDYSVINVNAVTHHHDEIHDH